MNIQTLKLGLLWIILPISLAVPPLALSKFDRKYHPVEIDIVTDQGEVFSSYPVTQQNLNNEYRAYLEAIKGENYALQIRNNTSRRIGLVIAVDGRNIISGKKSYLKHTENMYILSPHETQIYAGWRTSSTDIHRFYFTDIGDSYAHAFGDDSALGVIAIALYEEKKPKMSLFDKKRSAKSKAPAAGRSNDSVLGEKEEAGTGFGKHATSHAYRVHFKAKRSALSKYFYKYEWHESLCVKKIIKCDEPKNRFWPRDNYELGFAPFPPNY